ncbi:MAG: YgiQ family radical SAM protein [Lentimicrobiaceae bacterium]|nr:YgiQ family radical SAM protein [Lentimicrobiaceae bacterium]
MTDLKAWLPTTKQELELRGWDYADVILITGDAYVDHPSFGAAIIGRLIEQQGFRVAIIPQPNWKDDLRDFTKLGKPRLFFGITSGCMDSMVNHYTAAKRLRSTDAYTPEGVSGFRPDRATTVYSKIVRKLYPDSLIILGGIEASLRRFTHYDYWSNKLMPTILEDSQADLLVYGMGEQPICDILEVFKQKRQPQAEDFHAIPQIAYLTDFVDHLPENAVRLPSHEDCVKKKAKFAEAFRRIEIESNRLRPQKMIQKTGCKMLVVNPPAKLLSEQELDAIYDLPFMRLPHPKYEKRGEIPAFTMIQHSVTIHRGCFGGCSFCTISAHQGKFIVSRSEKSILKEIAKITQMPNFKGYISDLGGPSANMYKMGGKIKSECESCSRFSCIFPKTCENLCFNHFPLINLYRKASEINSVKKITIGSGIRYDLLFTDNKILEEKYGLQKYTEELICNHVSGRLKVAPEHTETHILRCMRKPPFDLFIRFKQIFDRLNSQYKLRQQLTPYFISSHPNCKLKDMESLKQKLKQMRLQPEQVQDFTPTPMTLSSAIFYLGTDPYTRKEVFCVTHPADKKQQNQYFF